MAQEIIQQPKWKKVEYSRNQIKKAGSLIRKESLTADEEAYAIKVIDNWRAAHAFPMHVIYMHLRRMAENHPDIIVAERLKRLDSIVMKLKREDRMSLWEMQDLGGCRFVVPELEDVYSYSNRYESSSKRHILKDRDDYIKNPKSSGYRSLHVVYQYQSDKTEIYNKNMLIELQFRTHLQHLWATAVETMSLFTKQNIKAGQGEEDVKQFFRVVSSLFALREKQPVIPGTSEDMDELISELEYLNSKHNYLELLQGFKIATDLQEKHGKAAVRKPAYYMLVLDHENRRLSIRNYKASEIEEANELYNAIENDKEILHLDAVLVGVSSMAMLKTAYPNYFSDLDEFNFILRKYLGNEKRKGKR